VIYTSDNGGRTGVLNGGKGDLGEGGLRVPMIVRGPGIKAGTYCNEPVISYDLAAKLAAELKAHVRAGLGEQAFAALERGEVTQRRSKGKGKGTPKKGAAK